MALRQTANSLECVFVKIRLVVDSGGDRLDQSIEIELNPIMHRWNAVAQKKHVISQINLEVRDGNESIVDSDRAEIALEWPIWG